MCVWGGGGGGGGKVGKWSGGCHSHWIITNEIIAVLCE